MLAEQTMMMMIMAKKMMMMTMYRSADRADGQRILLTLALLYPTPLHLRTGAEAAH